MKRLSFLMPFIALLLAVGGAFAMTSMQSGFQDEVYYWENEAPGEPEECIQTSVTPCEGGSNLCQKLIPTVGTRTLFTDNTCQEAYHEMP